MVGVGPPGALGLKPGIEAHWYTLETDGVQGGRVFGFLVQIAMNRGGFSCVWPNTSANVKKSH